MNRISEHRILMETACLWSKRGTCSRLRVGAVLSRNGRIIATGYNGNVSGADHCEHTTNDPCETAVHAEENVLYFAARHGTKTEGSDLYVTHNPCYRCARGLVNAGIARVVYLNEYRDTSGVQLLVDSGIRVFRDEGDMLVDWENLET